MSYLCQYIEDISNGIPTELDSRPYQQVPSASNLNALHLHSLTATGGSSRKEPKVVFIVSTVNLVLQQKERFEAHLSDKYSVGEISGAKATEIPLKYLLQHHTIVVMTAQILVNALNSKSKEEQVKLEDISLLLFDECHHAHKEHSYNRIMERYLALKDQPGRKDHLPQVWGPAKCAANMDTY